MIATVLAVALAAAPLAQEEDWQQQAYEDEGEDRPRLFLSAWGGTAYDAFGAGSSSTLVGGEVAVAFDSMDVAVAGYGYRDVPGATRDWTPVTLVRLIQRFRTRGGVEATFSLGAGAGRPSGWTAWYQVALGMRVGFGPVFLGGEIAFEQFDLLRLAAGLGVAF